MQTGRWRTRGWEAVAADGKSTAAIAVTLGISAPTVCLWRGRLARAGTKGLKEEARPGRPKRIQHSTRMGLLAMACAPAEEDGRATPTLDELLDKAVSGKVVDKISRRHLHRILQAGLDVHTGKVVATCRDRRTQADLLEFMEVVAATYPDRSVHVVWDKLNTHTAKSVWDDFNARHGWRFHFHFTPYHVSWVNQVELLFGIYARRVLRHASHVSTVHPRERTEAFVEQRNTSSKAFRWSFEGYPLQAGEGGERANAQPNSNS